MSRLSAAEEVARRNIRLFIAFRVLFTARFYYPVLPVIFLDFGLTIEAIRATERDLGRHDHPGRGAGRVRSRTWSGGARS